MTRGIGGFRQDWRKNHSGSGLCRSLSEPLNFDIHRCVSQPGKQIEMSGFSYLIDKIANARFSTDPFRHIYVEDFFKPEDFAQLIGAPEIASPSVHEDLELIRSLYDVGYRVIPFPGCVTDVDKYVRWHRKPTREAASATCEGFGMALRLYSPSTRILTELKNFLEGDEFNRAIASKFDIDFDKCKVDGGIQKYLDGYEISPHADNRAKAATFMVNINPSPDSERMNHHTHYMKFKAERQYVRTFWEGNQSVERCWVPWDWTETVFQQVRNNSIVIFAPSNDSLHAVKADYNHLLTQRTQLYGNLWYKDPASPRLREWDKLDLLSSRKPKRHSNSKLKKFMEKLTSPFRASRSDFQIGDRNK
jgi:hypothetical protein